MARRIRRIGFVGLGRMGLPMACRLVAAGYEVRGFDAAEPARASFHRVVARPAARPASVPETTGPPRTAGRPGIASRPEIMGGAADGLTPSGAVDMLAEAADAADAVVLMLPDSAVIATVAVDDGLLSAMRPGALLIDMSTSEPVKTEQLSAYAEARGIHVIGAPVIGGVRAAADGTLTIMAGGPGNAVARARPVFDALGSRVIHAGDGPGAGHALKALSNTATD